MSEAHEKRTATREPVHLVTEIELNGEQIGCAISRDASGSGFLLLTHLNLAPGSELTLRMYLPHETDARLLKASVVRCERILPGQGVVWDYRIAVALHDPPPDLQDLVQSLTKRASVPAPS